MTATHPWLEDFVEQLEQLDAPVLIVGAGGAISYATRAAERLLGAVEGSVAGVTMEQLLPMERRGELKNFEDVLGGGGGRRLRSALRLSDGRRLDVSLTLSPLVDTAGNVVAVSARYEPARSSAQWVRASLSPPRPSISVVQGPLDSLRAPAPLSSIPSPPGPGSSGPSSVSEQRLAPASRPAAGIHARLGQLESHLRWLEDRLSSPPSLSPLDDPRERARALLVVGEARDLTAQCRQALDAEGTSAPQPIPAPPKLPRM